MSSVFFDTNVLFTAYDSSTPDKQSRAQALIATSTSAGTGHTSVQVLGEFFHVAVVRKKVLTADEAEAIIRSLGGLHLVDIDYPLVRKAIENHRRFQTRYWDSLVIAAAQRSRCRTLYTEDLNTGQEYDGVIATNPFAPSFREGDL